MGVRRGAQKRKTHARKTTPTTKRTGDALAVRLREDVVEQRGLARAQEAGDDLVMM